WRKKVGTGLSIDWPIGKSSLHSVGDLRATPDGIAFLSLSAASANRLHIALLSNKAGKFIEPTPAALTASTKGMAKTINEHFQPRELELWRSSNEDAYPLSEPIWAVYRSGLDGSRRAMVEQFVDFFQQGGGDTFDQFKLGHVEAELFAECRKRSRD